MPILCLVAAKRCVKWIKIDHMKLYLLHISLICTAVKNHFFGM
jgi:hypothetical protein